MELIIHVRQIDAAKLLPQIELTRAQKIVLAAALGRRASYAGIADYRKHSAMELTGITSLEYETAKSVLRLRGLLSRKAAITATGRNALGWTRLEDLRHDHLRENDLPEAGG